MRYLTTEDVLKIHKDVIDETGGSHGIRDVGLLSSVVERPQGSAFGAEFYPDVWAKAAVHLHAIAMNHAFVDGNKRTAIACSARFLAVNGYHLKTSNDELERFVLSVVVDKLDIASIAQWFKLHSKSSLPSSSS